MTSSLEQRQHKHDISHLKTILDDNSLTFAEKAIGVKSVQTKSDSGGTKFKAMSLAGEIVVVGVDLAMAQDSTGPLAIRSLNEMGVEKLYDPSRVLLVLPRIYPPQYFRRV